MSKKVAIVGFAPSTRDKAPYNDPNWEIWTLNEFQSILPAGGANNITRWFEIHQRDTVLNSCRDASYIEKLKASTIPIMMCEKYDDIPMSEAYPLDDIIKALETDYFTNSISYMIAYAIYTGYEEIAIYGVDMAQDEEYCISPETMVLMKDLTYRRACEIKIGDEVVAFDENPQGLSNDRDFRVATVQGCSEIMRPSYRLTFEDGTQIVCSQEHRWLVGGSQNKWVETQNLIAKGDRVNGSCSHVIKPLEKWEEIRTYEAGYLASAIDGEGWLCQTKHGSNEGYNSSLGFSQRDNPMLSEFLKYAEKYNYKFNGTDKEIEEGDTKKISISKRKDILKFMGEIRPKRILSQLNINLLGRMIGEKVALVKKEYIGEQPVIALGTSTGTFIAEGFASHNSKERPSVEYFVGYARAKGIPVYIPPESDICKVPYYYGFQEQSASKIVKTIDPKKNDLTKRIQNDDFTVDEMLEHMDYKLKKYLFEYLPIVNKAKEKQDTLIKLSEQFRQATTPEEQAKINNEIIEQSKDVPKIEEFLYPMNDILMGLWEHNQTLKGAKKERLFLVGAESIATHLRTILCPYD